LEAAGTFPSVPPLRAFDGLCGVYLRLWAVFAAGVVRLPPFLYIAENALFMP